MVYMPNSMKDLEKHIINLVSEKVINRAENKLNELVLLAFKKHMDEDFYDEFNPNIYVRSEQMKNLIGVKMKPILNGNTVSFGVEFDSNKLPLGQRWYNSKVGRTSIRYEINGDDMREQIMDAILNGEFDDTFNLNPDGKRSKNIINEVKEDNQLLNDIVSDLKSMLISEGFIIL